MSFRDKYGSTGQLVDGQFVEYGSASDAENLKVGKPQGSNEGVLNPDDLYQQGAPHDSDRKTEVQVNDPNQGEQQSSVNEQEEDTRKVAELKSALQGAGVSVPEGAKRDDLVKLAHTHNV